MDGAGCSLWLPPWPAPCSPLPQIVSSSRSPTEPEISCRSRDGAAAQRPTLPPVAGTQASGGDQVPVLVTFFQEGAKKKGPKNGRKNELKHQGGSRCLSQCLFSPFFRQLHHSSFYDSVSYCSSQTCLSRVKNQTGKGKAFTKGVVH